MGFHLTARGQQSGMELVLCKDGKWRPDGGFVDVARKRFKTYNAAEEHGKEIHGRQRMLHWTFTVVKEQQYAESREQ